MKINEEYEDESGACDYEPDNLSDENSFVYPSNVDSMIEMVKSSSFQS